MNADKTEKIWADGGVKTSVLRRRPSFYVGVDLGQAQDYTAVAVVERDELVFNERDPVTWSFLEETRFHLRHLERVPLGSSYLNVAEHVWRMVQRAPLAGNVKVVVDATGVGAPVVDLLRRGGLGCRVMPVLITSGAAESQDGARFCVPKRDLIGGLEVAFERRRLRVAKGLRALDRSRRNCAGCACGGAGTGTSGSAGPGMTTWCSRWRSPGGGRAGSQGGDAPSR